MNTFQFSSIQNSIDNSLIESEYKKHGIQIFYNKPAFLMHVIDWMFNNIPKPAQIVYKQDALFLALPLACKYLVPCLLYDSEIEYDPDALFLVVEYKREANIIGKICSLVYNCLSCDHNEKNVTSFIINISSENNHTLKEYIPQDTAAIGLSNFCKDKDDYLLVEHPLVPFTCSVICNKLAVVWGESITFDNTMLENKKIVILINKASFDQQYLLAQRLTSYPINKCIIFVLDLGDCIFDNNNTISSVNARYELLSQLPNTIVHVYDCKVFNYPNFKRFNAMSYLFTMIQNDYCARGEKTSCLAFPNRKIFKMYQEFPNVSRFPCIIFDTGTRIREIENSREIVKIYNNIEYPSIEESRDNFYYNIILVSQTLNIHEYINHLSMIYSPLKISICATLREPIEYEKISSLIDEFSFIKNIYIFDFVHSSNLVYKNTHVQFYRPLDIICKQLPIQIAYGNTSPIKILVDTKSRQSLLGIYAYLKKHVCNFRIFHFYSYEPNCYTAHQSLLTNKFFDHYITIRATRHVLTEYSIEEKLVMHFNKYSKDTNTSFIINTKDLNMNSSRFMSVQPCNNLGKDWYYRFNDKPKWVHVYNLASGVITLDVRKW